ncbi:MAG: hypothetical protein L0241_02470 [Planctomycetia bacterium]|nr:hypothetical protein [Planctomycetia bacterium]
MRRLLTLFVLVFPVCSPAASAQEVIPVGGAGRLFRGAKPVCVPDCAPTVPDSPWTMPVDPGVPPMVPPTPPPGFPAIPRGDPTLPTPLDGLRNPFAQATEAGGQPARTANENFDGDFGGVFYKRLVTVGTTTVPRVVGFTQQVVGFTPITTQTITIDPQTGQRTLTITTTNNPIIVNNPIVTQTVVPQQRVVRLPLAARYSGILITDNDNPRPQDRVYFGYNFYDNIGGRNNLGLGEVDLQRQMAGFEKTFLDGDASVGMRLPFVQMYGPAGIGGTNNVGDLTLIFKYAFLNNRETGDLIGGGMVLTTPTGSGDAILVDGSKAPHSFIFQPWAGFVRSFDRAYLQGITSLLVPTDSQDPTLWNNSIGLGYYAYRAPERFLTAIVPTAEVHVRTPLSNRDPYGVVFLQDQVSLTGGLHFRARRAVLSGAVNVPIVGPRPWSLEALSFLNIGF